MLPLILIVRWIVRLVALLFLVVEVGAYSNLARIKDGGILSHLHCSLVAFLCREVDKSVPFVLPKLNLLRVHPREVPVGDVSALPELVHYFVDSCLEVDVADEQFITSKERLLRHHKLTMSILFF